MTKKRREWLILYRRMDGFIDAFVCGSIVTARRMHNSYAKAGFPVVMIDADDLLEKHLTPDPVSIID